MHFDRCVVTFGPRVLAPDVQINRGRPAQALDDVLRPSSRIQALLLESPADDLVRGTAAARALLRRLAGHRHGDIPEAGADIGVDQRRGEAFSRQRRHHRRRAEQRDRPHDQVGHVVGGSSAPISLAEAVAAERAVEAEQRRGQHLLLGVALEQRRRQPERRAAHRIAPAAPAPARQRLAVVAARHRKPGEGQAGRVVGVGPAVGLRSLPRERVGQDRRQRVAGAVGEMELERTGGRVGQHMAEFMPGDARIGRNAHRLRALPAAIVWTLCAVLQIGGAEAHFELRSPRRLIVFVIALRLAVGPHHRVDRQTVGLVEEPGPVAQQQGQPSHLEVAFGAQAIGFQPVEELLGAHVSVHGRLKVAAQTESACADIPWVWR